MGQACSAEQVEIVTEADFEPEACVGSARGSQMLCRIQTSGDHVVCAAVRPAEISSVVCATVGKLIFAYSTSTGKKVNTLTGHEGLVTCLAAHGKALFSGAVDKTIRRWDVNAAKVLFTMRGHTGPIWSMLLRKDALFSASDDHCVIRWDPYTGQRQAQFSRHQGPVRVLAGAQETLFSGADDCTIIRWNMKTCDILGEMRHDAMVTCLLVVDGALWSGCAGGDIRRWDTRTGEQLASIAAHADWVTCLAHVEGCLVSGGRDRALRRWDDQTGCLLATYDMGTISFRRRGGCLRAQEDGTVCISHVGDDEKFSKHDHADGRVSLRSKSCKFLSASIDGLVSASSEIIGPEQKFDLRDNGDGTVSIRTAHGYYIGESQAGRVRAARCSSEDGAPEEDQKFSHCFVESHYSGVTCLLAMEGTLLSGGADRCVKLWDFRSGMLLASLDGRTGVTCLLAADGSLYAGAARGAPLRLPRPKPLMSRLQPSPQEAGAESSLTASAEVASVSDAE